jgi:hypothetical protein
VAGHRGTGRHQAEFGTTGFEQGIDQAKLAADYQALTGQPLSLGQ